jgi:hypothetical protein
MCNEERRDGMNDERRRRGMGGEGVDGKERRDRKKVSGRNNKEGKEKSGEEKEIAHTRVRDRERKNTH